MPSHADFQLPGLKTHPDAESRLVHATVHAFSSISNRRRLENPLYAFWGQILHHLVADIRPGMIVAPQYMLYKASQDNPNLSLGTVADDKADERTPDFALLGIILADRVTKETIDRHAPLLTFDYWPDLQVAAWKPMTLVEIKRMAGRHFRKRRDFQSDLVNILGHAVLGVLTQARIVFEESAYARAAYDVHTLILIAAAGDWWVFRVATSDEFVEEDLMDDFLAGQGDESSVVYKQEAHTRVKQSMHRGTRSRSPTGHSDQGTKSPVASSSRPQHEPTPTMSRWTHIQARLMAELKQESKDAMPKKGRWSGLLLYGTKESNQCLYLIHEMLHKMMQGLQPHAQANLDRWKEEEDGYKSDETEGDDELDKLWDVPVEIRTTSHYIIVDDDGVSSDSSDEIDTLGRL